MEQVVLLHNKALVGPYQSTTAANLAARRLVQASDGEVVVYVYDVLDDTKALKRRYRVLKRLDGSIGFSA